MRSKEKDKKEVFYPITDTKINIKMEELRKELYKKFPSHHHAHIQIFSTFWGLHNLLVKEGGINKWIKN